MTYFQALWRAERAAILGLGICAILASVVSGLFAVPYLDWHFIVAFAWAGLSYAVILGVVPALVFGAPIYAALRHRGMLTVGRLLVCAAIPGALFIPFDVGLAGAMVVAGEVFALVIHATWQAKSNEI